jgi:hypothetical protein
MTDKIKVAVEGAWRLLYNGDEVAVSTNSDTSNIVLQTDAAWELTVNGAAVAEGSGSTPPPEPGPNPEPGKWPKIPQEMVDAGLELPLPKYGNKGNSSANVGAIGTAMWSTIYGYIGGDERAEVRENVEAILDNLVSSDKGPCGMNGPGAQLEALALAWFHILRETDLWPGLSDTIKKRIDAIFHATALIRAWEGNDSSDSNGEWTICGSKSADYRDIGPNIAFTIPAGLVLCGEWFGYDELSDWLEDTSIAAVRSEVKSAFGGTGGNLYRTLNWRNEGVSAASAEDYYRAGASSDAPSDSQINDSLANLTYYGAPFDGPLAKFLLPNDERGLNKVLPPARKAQGSNEWIGVNQFAVDDNQGMQVEGKKRGYCLGDGPSMPHLGGEGAMIYELNGTDEGGIRSAMGYAFWTAYLVNCMLLPMAASGNVALIDDGVDDFLERWNQALEIMQFFDAEDYNSIAHAKSKANGGPGPVVWSDGREDWLPEIQFFFWDAILGIARSTA